MRAILGIVLGLVAGLVAIVIVGIVGVGATFTPPAGIDTSDFNRVAGLIRDMPDSARIALAIAWLAGGFTAAFVARRIARNYWAAMAGPVLIAIFVFGSGDLIVGWMHWLWVAAPLAGGLLANALGGGRPAAPAEAQVAEPLGEA
jgi:hypothetical protein